MTPGHNGRHGMIRRALTSPLWLLPVRRHRHLWTWMSYPVACSICGTRAYETD